MSRLLRAARSPPHAQLRMEIDRLKIEPGSLLTPPSTAGTTLFPPLPPAALSLDTAKEEALVAALARLEVAESGFEALTETHTRYKLQSQMVYKLKQSRIEALSSRLSEGKPMTDGDDDLSVLCGEIDELRKQLDSPDFEAVKYKVLLDAANATTPAFSASSVSAARVRRLPMLAASPPLLVPRAPPPPFAHPPPSPS